MTNVGIALTIALVAAPLITAQAGPPICTPRVSQSMTPLNGYSVRLGKFDGVVYYTVTHDEYQVVTTFAASADALPIRFVTTLANGQHVTISVPQALDQPAIDLGILRADSAVVVDYTPPCRAKG